MRFSGRVVLVTGGTSGIGLAAARAFLEEGARVAIVGRRADRGRVAVRTLRRVSEDVRFLRGDVSRSADVRRLVGSVLRASGGIDVLFNNAGVYLQKPVQATTEREWDRQLAVNLKGYFLMAREVVSAMRRRGGGSIVNNCSISAHVGIAGEAAYAASKAGALLLTKVLAVELARYGIRVNSVSPGVIRTDMYDEWLRDQPDPRAAERAEIARHPLGRLGTPEDVVRAVLFLASDDAAFITGADLPVDGGYLAP
ncbi:MAG TPA: SDR family NAD(P)-dependent oxidoreductase [Thermoplasmata archaeon]